MDYLEAAAAVLHALPREAAAEEGPALAAALAAVGSMGSKRGAPETGLPEMGLPEMVQFLKTWLGIAFSDETEAGFEFLGVELV